MIILPGKTTFHHPFIKYCNHWQIFVFMAEQILLAKNLELPTITWTLQSARSKSSTWVWLVEWWAWVNIEKTFKAAFCGNLSQSALKEPIFIELEGKPSQCKGTRHTHIPFWRPPRHLAECLPLCCYALWFFKLIYFSPHFPSRFTFSAPLTIPRPQSLSSFKKGSLDSILWSLFQFKCQLHWVNWIKINLNIIFIQEREFGLHTMEHVPI